MNQKTENNITQVLGIIAKIFIRCLAFSAFILMVWFIWLLTCGDFGYEYYSIWFELTKKEFFLANLYGMSILKLLSLTFFLLPWISIKLVLNNLYKTLTPHS